MSIVFESKIQFNFLHKGKKLTCRLNANKEPLYPSTLRSMRRSFNDDEFLEQLLCLGHCVVAYEDKKEYDINYAELDIEGRMHIDLNIAFISKAEKVSDYIGLDNKLKHLREVQKWANGGKSDNDFITVNWSMIVG